MWWVKRKDKLKLSLIGIARIYRHNNSYYSAVKWFNSYLTHRTQRTQIQNATYQIIKVHSDVPPQGRHLRQILFTLFINDLPSVICCAKVLMNNSLDIEGFSFLCDDFYNFTNQCRFN